MIAVTGAGGFVGRALVEHLVGMHTDVRALVRKPSGRQAGEVVIGDIGAHTRWAEALRGAHCVVHCAARVHMMQDTADDPLAAFRQVNVEGTRKLAQDAVHAGVRRFVFLSTVKVMGEATTANHPFRVDAPPNPQDAYAQSKWEAEQALWQVARRSNMEVVVIRPPLVYGPGVRANFLRLMTWVNKGWPLPLGAVDNRRSLVALDNLVDLIVLCSHHPQAAGETFFASDGQDQSTADLIRVMAQALGRQPRLWPVPPRLLRLVAALTGQREAVSRLLDSLQVDLDHTRRRLGWQPPVTPGEGLRRLLAAEAE